MADIEALRAELDHVRWMVEDWKQRGSPAFEKATLDARLAAAEAAVANAIGAPVPSSEHVVQTAPATRPAPHPHASAPPRESSTARAGETMIDRETDARFWAQTGYKVGQKLDASDPTDKAMAKVWSDIFTKVKDEDRAGRLVLTYNHPAVEQHLADASVAHDAAVVHLDAAAQAPTPEAAHEHVQAAVEAQQIGEQRAHEAAAYQPPVASPAVAQAAATEAHAAAQQPPPGVIVFPQGHPAHHGQALPAHPELAQPSAPSLVRPPQSAHDHLALGQTAKAPAHAGHVHQTAPARRPPQSTVRPATIANLRDQAKSFAGGGHYVGVVQHPGGPLEHVVFPSRAELDHWYSDLAGDPSAFTYVAEFDADEGAEPSADLFGGSMTLEAHADAPLAPVPAPTTPLATTVKNNGKTIAIVAGVLAAAGLAYAIGTKKKSRGHAHR